MDQTHSNYFIIYFEGIHFNLKNLKPWFVGYLLHQRATYYFKMINHYWINYFAHLIFILISIFLIIFMIFKNPSIVCLLIQISIKIKYTLTFYQTSSSSNYRCLNNILLIVRVRNLISIIIIVMYLSIFNIYFRA